MTPRISPFVTLAICLIATIQAVPVSFNEDIVHVNLLGEKSNPRVRRSESDLPDQLTFSFPLHGNDLVLRLKRSRLLNMVTGDGPSNVFAENAGVYTDLNSGSAMIVKREAGTYSLDGHFIHNDLEYNLKPLARSRRDANNNAHRAFHDNDVNLAGDAVVDPLDKGEELIYSRDHKQKSSSVRNKRGVTQHVVEIAFIVDYKNYEKYVAYYGGSSQALTQMQLWFSYVAESINIRYESISDNEIAIRTTVTILKILTNEPDDDFLEDKTDASGMFHDSVGLNAFQIWYLAQRDIPTSDHYMLFTGFNITDAIGVANVRRVCYRAGVSIVEDSRNGIVGAVAAHELGHSLSALHDDEYRSCSDAQQYIMATAFYDVKPGNEGHPWQFSVCSIRAFKKYLSQVHCTLPSATSATNVLPAPAEGSRAGEVLDKDAQCKLIFNSQASSYCEDLHRGKEDSICGGMYCRDPNDEFLCWSFKPLEYTSCGASWSNKWCVRGMCVPVTGRERYRG